MRECLFRIKNYGLKNSIQDVNSFSTKQLGSSTFLKWANFWRNLQIKTVPINPMEFQNSLIAPTNPQPYRPKFSTISNLDSKLINQIESKIHQIHTLHFPAQKNLKIKLPLPPTQDISISESVINWKIPTKALLHSFSSTHFLESKKFVFFLLVRTLKAAQGTFWK